MSAWTPCSHLPPVALDVLVWHRTRPYNRTYSAVIGWWNGTEWRHYVSFMETRPIYQPVLWREIESPQHPAYPSYNERYR